MATRDETTRLCLVVTADAGEAARERLSAALAAADVASVIIAPGRSRQLDVASVRPLVELVQRANVAALIAGDARLARTLKADGVHLPASGNILAAYQEAREIVGRGSIVGADAGSSRHDAMELGEAGADYIAFGPVQSGDTTDEAIEQRLDLVSWWAEIFEPPCLALDVASPDDGAEFASTGADFIAVTLPDGASIADTRDRVTAFARAIHDAGFAEE